MKRLLNKRIAIVTILIFLLLVIGSAALIFSQTLNNQLINPETQQIFTAQVVMMKPGVSVIRENGETQTVDSEMDVFAGDKVKTSESGIAYVIFADNSSSMLDKNTEILISEQAKNGDTFQTSIQQLTGRTWNRVEKLLDSESDFEVDTPNTVAAVRGTKFGCNIFSQESVECYSIEHDIELTLENLDNQNVVLPESKWYLNDNSVTLENYLEKIADKGVKDQKWEDFNKCIADSARNELGANYSENFLKDKPIEESCLSILGDDIVVEEEKNEEPEQTEENNNTEPVVLLPKLTGVYLTENGEQDITCTWSAENSNKYNVDVKDDEGNIVGSETNLESNAHAFGDLNLVSERKYKCWVKAFGSGGDSGFMASNEYLYDASTGRIVVTEPDPSYYYIPQGVAGDGSYSGTTLSHLKVSFYIMNDNGDADQGKYANTSGDWQDEIYWHTSNITDAGSNNFNFGGTAPSINSGYVKIKVILINTYTGTELVETGDMRVYAYNLS